MQPALSPGQILAGKYRVERVLGAGAMGMVLSATHLVLGTRVAIKVMLGGVRKTQEHTTRFLREAQVAAVLRSQHVAKVLDVGELESGAPYIVMEYLEGKDLSVLLKERGVFSVEEAVGCALQACEALAEAHAHGIVHRDIKPANLFLTTGIDHKPCIKVVDFGIARVADSTVTGTAEALGSPLFMSPEQLQQSRAVDARSDIWSLGVTLYMLLAGAPPAYAKEMMPLITLILLEPPVPLSRYRPDVPGPLAAAIMQALEKRPEQRWPNVATFAEALARFASPEHASYTARIAAVQQVEVPVSRPTTEIPRPAPAAIEAEERLAAAPPVVPLVAPVLASQRAAKSYRAPLVAAATLTAIALPAALLFGLRARAHEPIEARPGGSATTATRVGGEATAEVGTSGAGAASAAPAPSGAVTAAPIATQPSSSATARPPAAKPGRALIGGARR
jgi:serine/threonine-protein kinase